MSAIESTIVFTAYCLFYGCLVVLSSLGLYLLIEGIEKALEILEGELDG